MRKLLTPQKPRGYVIQRMREEDYYSKRAGGIYWTPHLDNALSFPLEPLATPLCETLVNEGYEVKIVPYVEVFR